MRLTLHWLYGGATNKPSASNRYSTSVPTDEQIQAIDRIIIFCIFSQHWSRPTKFFYSHIANAKTLCVIYETIDIDIVFFDNSLPL